MKSQKGFIVLLLPLLTLFITGFLSLALLGNGIKNSTFLQSLCFKKTIETQRQLKQKLTQLLKMNQNILFLNQKRKKLIASIAISSSLGLAPMLPLLKANLKWVELQQKTAYIKQKLILYSSKKIKKKIVYNFKTGVQSRIKSEANSGMKKIRVRNIKSKSLSKKPLAVIAKKISPYVYLYSPRPNFSKYQAIELSWDADLFSPLSDWIVKVLNLKINLFSHQTCKSTLKRRNKLWQAHLTY